MEGREKKDKKNRDRTGHNKMKGGKGGVEGWRTCLCDRWRENDPEITLQQVTSDPPGSRLICWFWSEQVAAALEGGVWR